ncbi:MAG: hypothetical protein H7Y18_16755 [Clostridiaceae bacterium]|nr:hypothetical protein [Clostridiaceae bacterium]
MKIKNKKISLIIFLFFSFILLFICNIYVIKIKNDKNLSLNTNVVKGRSEQIHKTFNYSDILNTINSCSSNFILIKIDKNSINKNFINTEVKYKGEIGGLLEGLKMMKMQEIIKDINEVNIVETEDKEYIAEINVDFFKFK